MKKQNFLLIGLFFFICGCGLAQPTISVATNDSAKCVCDGSVRLYINGGTAPFDIVCTNGSSITGTYDTIITTPEIFCSGDYIVTVTDSNGWVVEEVFTVGNTDPTITALDLTYENDVCLLCVGTAEVDNIVGGTSPFTYSWTDGSTTAQISDLCKGYHSVTVTDANLCAHVDYVTIINEKLDFTTTVTPSCGDDSTGSIAVNYTGVSGSYTIYIDSVATSSPITGLAPGTYTIVVENDNDSTCTVTHNVTVGDATPFIFFNNQTNVSCNGVCDGSVTAMAFGATSVVWSNGATTSTISNLCAGSYKVTVTNSYGCTASTMATITQPEVLTASISCTQVFNTYTLTANQNGGTSPYTYEWAAYTSGGQPTTLYTQSITGYPNINQYYVTVTDDNGCTAVACKRIKKYTGCEECAKTMGVNSVSDISNVLIYPNPVTELLNIELELNAETSIQVNMLNVLGEEIKTISVGRANDEHLELDVRHLPAGVYFIELKTKNSSITEKVIIR